MKKFSINFVTLVLWGWIFFFVGANEAFCYVFAIFLHEVGHYFASKKLGYMLSKFAISPFGVSLSGTSQNFVPADEMLIALCGPLANIVSGLTVVALWWIAPSTYFFTRPFVEISFAMAFTNLLPAYPLDGGRIFVCLFSEKFSAKKCRRVAFFVNILLAIVFFVLFFVLLFINFNPTFLLFAFFLVCGSMEVGLSSSYQKISIFSKCFKNFSRTSIFCVDENVTVFQLLKHCERKKTVIFCCFLKNGKSVFISEKLLQKLCLLYSPETELKNILKNN